MGNKGVSNCCRCDLPAPPSSTVIRLRAMRHRATVTTKLSVPVTIDRAVAATMRPAATPYSAADCSGRMATATEIAAAAAAIALPKALSMFFMGLE